jgi:hypothetical protein
VIPELERIKRLLWVEWDPIGCGAPQDEYHSYAFQVFIKLNNGQGSGELAQYLEWVETDYMGLSHSSGRAKDIAHKLVAIHAHSNPSVTLNLFQGPFLRKRGIRNRRAALRQRSANKPQSRRLPECAALAALYGC